MLLVHDSKPQEAIETMLDLVGCHPLVAERKERGQTRGNGGDWNRVVFRLHDHLGAGLDVS
jgi:hypothetical protein